MNWPGGTRSERNSRRRRTGRVVSNLFRLAAIYDREHPGVIDYSAGGTEVRVVDCRRRTWHATPTSGSSSWDAPLDEVGRPATLPGRRGRLAEQQEARLPRETARLPGLRHPRILDRRSAILRQLTVLDPRRASGANADLGGTASSRMPTRSRVRLLPGLAVDASPSSGRASDRARTGNQPGFRNFFVCQADFSWKRRSHCLSSTGSDSNGGAVRHRSGCVTARVSRS